MIFFMKSASCRRVSNEDLKENNKYLNYYYKGCDDEKKDGPSLILTVWRKSLLVNCSGFTVIDCKGNLVYRVDNYCGRPAGEIVLMDGSGKSVLTIRRHKKLRLVNEWGIYKGETSENYNEKNRNNNNRKQKAVVVPEEAAIGYIKKNMSLIQAAKGFSNVLAQVYIGPPPSSSSSSSSRKKQPTYVIEGCYRERDCKVFDKSTRKMVAEIKRKEAVNGGGVSFGLDVFQLVVVPGFDPGFAMGLVLLLDQMYS